MYIDPVSPTQFLVGLPDGGFVIETEGKPTVRADPTGQGWRIQGNDRDEWTLERAEACAGGFVVRASGAADEKGRSMPLVGVEETAGPSFLLLDSGRLFRIRRRGPRDDGFDLLGWETPGAFLVARPGPRGWTLVSQIACSGLEDMRVLTILFAAEILDAERSLGGTS